MTEGARMDFLQWYIIILQIDEGLSSNWSFFLRNLYSFPQQDSLLESGCVEFCLKLMSAMLFSPQINRRRENTNRLISNLSSQLSLILAMREQKGKAWSIFSGATCWLPMKHRFYFTGPMPNGNQAVIGTSAALLAELEVINGQGWQADEETILSWTRTEGYPADGNIQKDGNLIIEKQHTEYPTESLAKYAFSIFWQALRFSEEHKVPILMDY